MKKKIFKILSVIVVIILCVSLFCINVLADDFNDVSNYQVIKIYNDYGNMNFSSSIFSLHDPFPDDSYVCDFITYNIYPAYNAYNIDFDFPDTFSNGQIITVSGAFCLSQYTTSFTINFGSFTNVQLFDSSCKKLYNELDSYTYYYYVPFSYTFEVSNVSLAKLDKIFFNYRGSAPLYSFGISNLSFQSSIDVDGIVNGATNNIINNQNNNASNIQANQDKNTDKILNGDSNLDSSGETDKVNGAVGDIDGATDEALGGKSDSEIQGEVEGALDWNKIGNSVDFDKAERISKFYDRCLTVFGSKYNSLLLLSLILGLAAFLIGRKYG